MVQLFTDNVTEALDEMCPIKTIKIRSNYKFGLSDNTRSLIKSRDVTRSKNSMASGNDKIILSNKYKVLRNICIHFIH